MSILQAMYSGSSALINFGEAMTVIGNNLANANTTAFKGSTSSFQDVLIQTVGTNGVGSMNQVGTGVGLADIQQNMKAGSTVSTANVTDMSIDGRGFFKVRDNALSSKLNTLALPMDTFYTRAGAFEKNKDGYLITSGGGLRLQGWKLDANGNHLVSGEAGVQDILLPTADENLCQATSNVTLPVNLDDRSTASLPFHTSVRVYDSKGNPHSLRMAFDRTANANEWSWTAQEQDMSTGDLLGTPTTANTLKFDSTGHYLSGSPVSLEFTLSNGATTPLNLAFDLSGSTQVASESSTGNWTADGYSPGNLDTLAVDRDGIVSGLYTNGQTRKMYQIALVDFSNENALEQVGANLYKPTVQSGQPMIGIPQSSRLGSIASNSLEQSNVDISNEFIRMITTQRGFQANSRIVSVSDSMLEELISLKR
ncbi:MAG: flagellar hook protein FlgE [Magnetococcales bacterium]|nr:flagellar hook protein FlgE [Magnetococcales bacterium]